MSQTNDTAASLSAPGLINIINQLHGFGIQDEIPLPSVSATEADIAPDVLQDIIDQIDAKLAQCQEDHKELGIARSNGLQKRDYLSDVAMRFAFRVMQNLQDGQASRINDSLDNGSLRDSLSEMYDDFAHDLIVNGRKTVVVSDMATVETMRKSCAPHQEIITTHEMLARVNMSRHRRAGPLHSLPGMKNDYDLVARLFREQSQKWETMAQEHVSKICRTVQEHLHLMIESQTTKHTALLIKSELLERPMADRQTDVVAKVHELAAPYSHCVLLTKSRVYAGTLHANEGGSNAESSENDPLSQKWNMKALSVVLNHLNAYYDTALDIFIDNVLVLAIEMVLLKDLHLILTPATINSLNTSQLNKIGSESLEQRQHREKFTLRLTKLEKSKRLCEDYQRDCLEADTNRPMTPGLTDPTDAESPMPLLDPITPSNATHHVVNKKSFEWRTMPDGAFGPALRPTTPSKVKQHSRSSSFAHSRPPSSLHHHSPSPSHHRSSSSLTETASEIVYSFDKLKPVQIIIKTEEEVQPDVPEEEL